MSANSATSDRFTAQECFEHFTTILPAPRGFAAAMMLVSEGH